MAADSYNSTGSLKISEEVISTIAGIATGEIKGVAGLSTYPSASDQKLRGFLGRKGRGRAIKLEMKDGEAVIDVYINLYLGVKIPEAASEVQSRVKDAVQNMTGIAVSKVNVHIAGVVIPPVEPDEPV